MTAPPRAIGLVVMIGLSACQPDTTRPSFTPVPDAPVTEVRLPTARATEELARLLRADSIPTSRVRVRDGYLESSWFDAASGRPVHRRPIGPNVVRVRAWADPTRVGFSQLSVETVYRPLADPSLPERELDRQVARDHPVAIKVRSALQDLVKRFGGPPRTESQRPAAPSRVEPEEAPPPEENPAPEEGPEQP